MPTQKVNLYAVENDVKAQIAATVGWDGYYTLRLNPVQSRYEIDQAYDGKSKAIENLPANVAQALINAAQASLPDFDTKTGQQILNKPALDKVTFELQLPQRPDNLAPDPKFYPPTEQGKQQYLKDYGAHVAATRKANEDPPQALLTRWG